MAQPVIQVRDLGKCYQIRSTTTKPYNSLREDLVEGIKGILKGKWRQQHQTEDFWAIKDISFDVNQGEVVGIIGRNGAGKSTLLKVLSQIVRPTTGEAIIRGRIGSLLEIGTGFHPELTGRENIFMNGSVLGMKRSEINHKFDEIVSFAEVEKFLDTPVKFYSSGMYVRLAFAVAAHLEPEILIVDEVLAVGDIGFQQKCLGKMGEFGESGRTILFVSHNISATRKLCSRTILINEGTINADGKTNDVLNTYLNSSFITSHKSWSDNQYPGNDKFQIISIKLINALGELVSSANISEDIYIEISFEILKDTKIQFSLVLLDSNGEQVFSSLSNQEKIYHGKRIGNGKYISTCHIYSNLLNAGKFNVSIIASTNSWNDPIKLDNVISIDAIDDGVLKGDYLGDFGGLIRPKLEWKTKML